MDAADLASMWLLKKWSRKRLAKHYETSEKAIQWWFAELKRRDFTFKSISPERKKLLKKAYLKQG